MLLTPIMTPPPPPPPPFMWVKSQAVIYLTKTMNRQKKSGFTFFCQDGEDASLAHLMCSLEMKEQKNHLRLQIYGFVSHTASEIHTHTHTEIQTVSPQKSQIVFFLTANTNCYSVALGCGSHVASSNSFSSEGDCRGRGRGDGTMLAVTCWAIQGFVLSYNFSISLPSKPLIWPPRGTAINGWNAQWFNFLKPDSRTKSL